VTEVQRTRALVLLVDDSPTQAKRAVQALEQAGYRVRLATNGREALDQARRWNPDVLVSDVLMPVMDGFALAREVRRDPTLAGLPVVLHTMTYVDPKDEEFARGLGVTRFVVKPSDPNDLVAEVRLALEAGHRAAAPAIVDDAEGFLKGYSERLAAKLEDKVLELEEAYRQLQQTSQEQIRQAENKYQTLVEHLPVMTYALTLDDPPRAIYVSPQMTGSLGYSEAEWQDNGSLWDRVVHPADQALVAQGLDRLRHDDVPLDREHRVMDRTGQERWVHHLATCARVGQGPPLWIQGILTDITERKRFEAEQARLRDAVDRERATLAAVMASMSDGLIVTDTSGVIVYCNARVGDLLGVDTTALIGQSANDVLQPPVPSEDVPAEEAEAGSPEGASLPTYEIAVVTPERRDVQVQLFAVTSAEGATDDAQRYGALLRDVTAERNLARAKDELVSVVSHELRTPLASVMGFAELLLLREFPEERRRQFLETMLREGRRLTSLITDFLDLQRLSGGMSRVTLQPTDLSAVIEQSVTSAGTDDLRPIEVRVPDDLPEVTADADRLQQVLVNLLGNARKYSPDGGNIIVTVRVVRSLVEVAIVDHGLGIPPEALPRLFQTFYRVDSEDRSGITGTGLGLAIVKKIIDAHGGTIRISSEGKGRGTTVTFTLPIVTVVEPLPPPHADPAEGGGYLLIVEDDEAFVTWLSETLRPVGYLVHAVASAETALQAVGESIPAAVLLDLRLGTGLDGWDLLAVLRGRPETTHLPAIIISGYDEHARGQALGVEQYLSKPVSRRDLLGALEKLGISPETSVLVVGEDAAMRQLLIDSLAESGIPIQPTQDAEQALSLLDGTPDAYGLLVLEIGQTDLAESAAWMDLNARPSLRDLPVVVCTGHDLSATEAAQLEARAHKVVREGDGGRVQDAVALAPGLPLQETAPA
jgi:PAS domain S-box-containing protein